MITSDLNNALRFLFSCHVFLKLFLPSNKTRNDIPTDGHIMSKQFDEQKDQVAVEQILSVVFLNVERPSPVSHYFKLSI